MTATDRIMAAVADGAETCVEVQAVCPDLRLRLISGILATNLRLGTLVRTGTRRYPHSIVACVTVRLGAPRRPIGRPRLTPKAEPD